MSDVNDRKLKAAFKLIGPEATAALQGMGPEELRADIVRCAKAVAEHTADMHADSKLADAKAEAKELAETYTAPIKAMRAREAVACAFLKDQGG